MFNLFTCHPLTLAHSTAIRLLRCYVFSALLYGVESWILTQASSQRLEPFEMWQYLQILRISWTAHVTNKNVLEQLNKKTEILNTIERRKLEYLRHIMTNSQRYKLLQLILQGNVEGRRGPGAGVASHFSKIFVHGSQCLPQDYDCQNDRQRSKTDRQQKKKKKQKKKKT